MRVVLQEEVYCRKTVLQYSLMGPELYYKGLVRRLGHNTKFCIATVGWARRWAGRAGRAGSRLGAGRAGAGRAGRARGAGGWEQHGKGAAGNERAGERACGAGGGRLTGRARQAGRKRWASSGHVAGAQPGRWARGLGACAGLELCIRRTRPVFRPVRLSISLSQIFLTLFLNPVHEHCSARIFFSKKNIYICLKKYLKIN